MNIVPDCNPFTLFPVEKRDIWTLRQRHNDTLWQSRELDFSGDINDWNTLPASDKMFLKHVLAFFAAADGIVAGDLVLNFYNRIEVKELRSFFSIQLYIEDQHNETYSKLVDTYITDSAEKARIFNAMTTIDAVKRMTQWTRHWACGDVDTLTLIVVAICTEGIFFAGLFCAIYWLRLRGIMPGLCAANDFIARDECLHVDMYILLYTKYSEGLPDDVVKSLFADAVELAIGLMRAALPQDIMGMSVAGMTKYIQYITDVYLLRMGHSKMFDVANPFVWMDEIGITKQSNFFDLRPVADYQRMQHDEGYASEDC